MGFIGAILGSIIVGGIVGFLGRLMVPGGRGIGIGKTVALGMISSTVVALVFAGVNEILAILISAVLSAVILWIAIRQGFLRPSYSSVDTRAHGPTAVRRPEVKPTTGHGQPAVDLTSRFAGQEPRASAKASKPLERKTRPPEAVFISYRRDDTIGLAGRLKDKLANEFLKVFFDLDSIEAGRDFRQAIREQISEADVVLILIGESWRPERLLSPNDAVLMEITEAFAQEKRIIPLQVAGAKIPNPSDLPPAIRDLAFLNALPLRIDPDFHPDADRLIGSIKRVSG